MPVAAYENEWRAMKMAGRRLVFIDGGAGTTGLRIVERLSGRDDIELITLPEEKRKDPAYRAEAMAASSVTFLCLPDAAAVEAVELCDNPDTVIIDCSTAHRTAPGWAYGFPELSPLHYEAIRSSKRIANPGCHASGAIAILYPLIKHGIISPSHPVAIHSLTGYSGGGKSMIANYESDGRDSSLDSPAEYALGATHKHLPEIRAVCSLDYAPAFNPIVSDFYSGMITAFPLISRFAKTEADAPSLRALYAEHYRGSAVISVSAEASPPSSLYANALSGRDSMKIFVTGGGDTINIFAVFCNLGKGASGAAIENMNIALGLPQERGLLL